MNHECQKSMRIGIPDFKASLYKVLPFWKIVHSIILLIALNLDKFFFPKTSNRGQVSSFFCKIQFSVFYFLQDRSNKKTNFQFSFLPIFVATYGDFEPLGYDLSFRSQHLFLDKFRQVLLYCGKIPFCSIDS